MTLKKKERDGHCTATEGTDKRTYGFTVVMLKGSVNRKKHDR